MPAPEPRTAQPGGRPEEGPTALPARSGPARPGRGGCPLARPPTSVRPGSPQLPVVFLLLEQLPGLRHGPCRTPTPPPPPPPPPRTRRRTECPSPLLPPTRCLQGAPPTALRTRGRYTRLFAATARITGTGTDDTSSPDAPAPLVSQWVTLYVR